MCIWFCVEPFERVLLLFRWLVALAASVLVPYPTRPPSICRTILVRKEPFKHEEVL